MQILFKRIKKIYHNKMKLTRILFMFHFYKSYFKDLKLNRIEARCMVENLASAKVLEKLGFIFEGIMRKQIFAKEKYWDVKIYSLLKDDCN